MDRSTRTGALVALGLAGALAIVPVSAQEYPAKPVTIVMVLAAGTGLDTVVRTYSGPLAQSLGRPIIFDNRPGANGLVAINAMKNMPDDGHTLLVSTSAAMAINPSTFRKLPYDPAKDFVPVSLYLKSPFVLVVHPSLPVRTVPDLVRFIRQRPGKLSCSSTGHGGAPRLSMELFMHNFGLDVIHVPYKNSPQAISDIAAGHVQLGFAEAGASQQLIHGKRLRALAVSSLTRFGSLPEVPTLAEATARPDLEAVSWHVLVAPASAPRTVVNRLHSEMARIVALPEVRDRIASLDLIPVEPQSIEDKQRYIASETRKWGDLIRKLGLEGSQ